MFKKIREFFTKTPIGVQIYSFVKTYITVFLGIYLTLSGVLNELDIQSLPDINIADINIIALSAKGALISILRNIYKILTETK